MAQYSRRKGCVLLGAGLASLMAALGAELGDQLRLRPAAGRTARATLVKVEAQPEPHGAAVSALAAPAAIPGSQVAPSQPLLPPPPPQQRRAWPSTAAGSGRSSRAARQPTGAA